MQRKFRITIDGRAYDVVVEEIADDASTLSPSAVQPAASAVAAPARRRPRLTPVRSRKPAPATKSRRWPAPSS